MDVYHNKRGDSGRAVGLVTQRTDVMMGEHLRREVPGQPLPDEDVGESISNLGKEDMSIEVSAAGVDAMGGGRGYIPRGDGFETGFVTSRSREAQALPIGFGPMLGGALPTQTKLDSIQGMGLEIMRRRSEERRLIFLRGCRRSR